MKSSQHKRIIISGGGTGGHVFPAISIADELRSRLKDAEILFVGAKKRMEMEKVPEAGYNIIGLPVEGFLRKLSMANIKVILKLMVSLRIAGKIINDFKPDAVVGVGGFASGPILRSAASRGIPTLIQEQNSYAGLTNRLLGKKVNKICVAYEGMGKYFPQEKIIITGNPVRNSIRDFNTSGSKKQARKEFGLHESDRVILVIGGSLGARSINNAVIAGLNLLSETDVKVIWQCGSYYHEDAIASLKDIKPGKVVLRQFIKRMEQAYHASDVIVARAGAITISELCHVGKPAILIPSPNVAEDHQTRNAQALVQKNAALSISDEQAESKMMGTALDLLKDEEKQAGIAERIKSLAIIDSGSRIADEIISLMN